ncbi:membrane protein [Paenibacillus darwinianus]|uniref:Membrane protein n=1 Tax=Paenibacillus darwinianus TaxID=1380763 RepID=A0A9W5S0L5_9BACL|nr:YdcF family protein [Paenibacillus darwinianus]EXX87939.1 membrane protein [Paenibacillus darwinianus]EXX88349.1 membrane protein [Paenibacillus darwinianus]EXX88389.1 membrane protein [Paenibacillus darwinianus]
MFYILLLVTSFLLPPGLWILVLVGFGCIIFRRNRRISIFFFAFVLIFYLSTTSLVSQALIRSLENDYSTPEMPEGDVIVVLMGGATADTPGIGGPGHPSGETSGRLITAAALQRALGLPILVSGGQVYPDSASEGDTGKKTLISLGIPPAMINVENASRNTAENAEYTASMLREMKAEKPILVTSAIHMARSVLYFKQVGMEPLPYPTAYLSNRKFVWHTRLLYPSYDAVNDTGHALKEYLGIISIRLFP